MKVKGVDHLVLNVQDVDEALEFYSQILGLDVLRLDEYRRGEAPFPSVRISSDALIDLVERPRSSEGRNVDHFCLIIEPTDMNRLAADLKAKGIAVSGDVGKRWGAHGWGVSFYIKDPDGNVLQLLQQPTE